MWGGGYSEHNLNGHLCLCRLTQLYVVVNMLGCEVIVKWSLVPV